MAMNGALAGLVAITAEPLMPSLWLAALIGCVGALIMMGATKALETFKIDDVVGAIPVHLAAGIWGTLAVVLSNPEASLMTQLIGITAIGTFVTCCSLALWFAMKFISGIRLHWSQEDMGSDIAELGVRAYNFEFDASTMKEFASPSMAHSTVMPGMKGAMKA